ncbi:S1C family serine protease [Streptomyces sirii]|uniref:S1C family serine protease n=1 Tax=Streptomyces sirii TaxID=3127701 RepID=UPI003D361187
MDDGKAAGSKLKWWSRPGRTPGTQPSAEAGPQAVPPADGPAETPVTDASGMSGVPDAEESGDWIVRPPQRSAAPAAAPEATDATAAREAAMAGERPGSGEISGVGEELAVAAAGSAERTGAEPPAPPTATAATSAEAPAAPPRPLHPEDPYGTPPYGGPGPWAPAPPVQRPEPRPAAMGWAPGHPGATPAQGTALPPAAGPLPPYGAPAQVAGYAGPPQSPPTAPRAAHGSGPAAPPARPPAAPSPTAEDRAPAAPGADQRPPERTDEAAHARAATEPGGSARPVLHKPGPQQPGSPTDAPQAQPHPAPAPPGGPHGPAPTHDHAPAPHGAWHQYDPWSAPLQGGPVAVPPPGSGRSRRGALVVGAVALALLAGGVGGGIGAYVERYGGINDIKLPQAAGDAGGREPDSVAGIAQTALPGVVTLHVRGNAEQGTGTGFVLDRQGHILTNNHVVEPAGAGGEISVTFSGGQTAKAKVIGRDGGYDLAVVQVEGVTGLRPLTLGNSDSVRVGDPVVAIGAPYDLANTVTSGIISAKQRPITAGGEKGDGSDVSYVDALQTDAPINPGNSGGPLVDAKARVIGINSAIRAADSGSGLDGGGQGGGQGGSIGLGFAIPINQARRVAEELINTGRATHPVIGVTLEMEYAGDGARVGDHTKDGKPAVIPGGPGAKAGIKPGDVITKVDGAPVHSGEELIVKIRSHRPGDTLMLTLQREGKERSIRLRLGSSTAG